MEGYLGTPHSQSCTSETGKFTTYFFYQCENFETKLFNLMETWTILEQLDEGVGSLLVRTQYRNSWLYSSQEFLPWFGFSFVYADFGSYITSYCMCKQQKEDFSIKIIKKQYWVHIKEILSYFFGCCVTTWIRFRIQETKPQNKCGSGCEMLNNLCVKRKPTT